MFRRILLSIIIIVMATGAGLAGAQGDESRLRERIKAHNEEIRRLEAEIKQYEAEITTNQAEQSTLQSKINQLDLTRRKLASDINLTEEKIEAAELTIDQLKQEIVNINRRIDRHRQSISQSLKRQYWLDQEMTNIFVMLLSQEKWSNVLTAVDQLTQIQDSLHEQMARLADWQERLNQTQDRHRQEKQQQVALAGQLIDQKSIADNQRQAEQRLLAETQSQEAQYQALVVDRRERMRQVQQEILRAEQDLDVVIDPTQIPAAGPILAWPLDNVYITQYFGNTAFATKNPQIYSGRGHNGIDLRAAIGTPVKSSLRGLVIGVGDTDLTCRGASYGKWILIEHPNGLTSLYAHLSLIRVSEGQVVDTGEVIGYSGDTGYTTGPHLHFTVYASRGVEIGNLQSQVPGCGVYRLPLGPPTSYMNPLSYLISVNND